MTIFSCVDWFILAFIIYQLFCWSFQEFLPNHRTYARWTYVDRCMHQTSSIAIHPLIIYSSTRHSCAIYFIPDRRCRGAGKSLYLRQLCMDSFIDVNVRLYTLSRCNIISFQYTRFSSSLRLEYCLGTMVPIVHLRTRKLLYCLEPVIYLNCGRLKIKVNMVTHIRR